MVSTLFEIHELSALQQKEKVLIPTYPEKEKKTFEIRINRAYLRNAAAMIAAIVLFFAFSTPVENTDVQKEQLCTVIAQRTFEQIEKQSVAITPVYVKNDAANKQRSFLLLPLQPKLHLLKSIQRIKPRLPNRLQ